jgi:hypothetical protein
LLERHVGVAEIGETGNAYVGEWSGQMGRLVEELFIVVNRPLPLSLPGIDGGQIIADRGTEVE